MTGLTAPCSAFLGVTLPDGACGEPAIHAFASAVQPHRSFYRCAGCAEAHHAAAGAAASIWPEVPLEVALLREVMAS